MSPDFYSAIYTSLDMIMIMNVNPKVKVDWINWAACLSMDAPYRITSDWGSSSWRRKAWGRAQLVAHYVFHTDVSVRFCRDIRRRVASDRALSVAVNSTPLMNTSNRRYGLNHTSSRHV